jgi:hypothetical protein
VTVATRQAEKNCFSDCFFVHKKTHACGISHITPTPACS